MIFSTLILAVVIPFTSIAPAQMPAPEPKVLAAHEFSFENRHKIKSVNNVFKENILLAIYYTANANIDPKNINWDNIKKPFEYKFPLRSQETFAFHDDVLPDYEGKITKTTNAHFSWSEGFKSDGYLIGDGVCHLASILYWVAKDANLDAFAPTRHDFAPVPDIPREYGVSIYSNKTKKSKTNELQNLYITNNKSNEIAFIFKYDGNILTVKAIE
jgi:hypothetical protein